MLGMVGLSASDQTRQHLGIGMDENPFHEMSTFSMSERFVSFENYHQDAMCSLVLRSCFLGFLQH